MWFLRQTLKDHKVVVVRWRVLDEHSNQSKPFRRLSNIYTLSDSVDVSSLKRDWTWSLELFSEWYHSSTWKQNLIFTRNGPLEWYEETFTSIWEYSIKIADVFTSGFLPTGMVEIIQWVKLMSISNRQLKSSFFTFQRKLLCWYTRL